MKKETTFLGKSATPQDNKELFTGGEWEVQKSDKFFYINSHDNIAAIPHTSDAIGVKKPYYESKANAYLIAQAPAMYRALKNLLETLPNAWAKDKDVIEAWEILQKANPKQ